MLSLLCLPKALCGPDAVVLSLNGLGVVLALRNQRARNKDIELLVPSTEPKAASITASGRHHS